MNSSDKRDIYGSFPVAQIRKYDRLENKVVNRPNIGLQYNMQVLPRITSKPMIDLKVIEWNPKTKKPTVSWAPVLRRSALHPK